jgi:hypothetical protein
MPTPGGYVDRPLGNPKKDETILSELEAFNQEAYQKALELAKDLIRETSIPSRLSAFRRAGKTETATAVNFPGVIGVDPARPGGDQTVAFRYDLESRSVGKIFWSRVEEKLRAEWAKEDTVRP